MSVFGAANSGLGMPANPGLKLRLMTTTVRAWYLMRCYVALEEAGGLGKLARGI